MSVALRRYVPQLRRRDGDDCAICHAPIDFSLKAPDPMSRTVDHLVPRYHGGATVLPNLRLAHLRCNNLRGSGRGIRRRKAPAQAVPEPGDVPVAVCMQLPDLG